MTLTAKPCPYRDCRSFRGHTTPHMFEAPQIEAFEREAAALERHRIEKAVAALRAPVTQYDWSDPPVPLHDYLDRDAVLAAIREVPE